MRNFLAAGVAVLMCCSNAHATQIVTNFNLVPSTAGLYQVFYPLVDTSSYKINWVDINLSADIYGSIAVQGYDYVGGNATAFATGNVSIFSASQNLLNAVTVSAPSYSQYLQPYDGSEFYTNNTSFTADNLIGGSAQDVLLTDANSLSYFAGVGQNYLILSMLDNSSVTSDIQTINQITTLFDANITVTVDYGPLTSSNASTNVPEPSALWLFGAGVVGLGVMGMRRRVI